MSLIETHVLRAQAIAREQGARYSPYNARWFAQWPARTTTKGRA